MKRSILVRGARQLVTLRGPAGPRRGDLFQEPGIIEDGSVLVVNGMITSVGPTRRVENLAEARSAELINATGHVILPGFVDSHTELISAPAKSTQFRFEAEERSADSVSGTAAAGQIRQYLRTTPAGTLESNANKYIDMCLRHGTTTLEVKTGFGLNVSGELKLLRVISGLHNRCISLVSTFRAASPGPPEGEHGKYMEWLLTEMLPRLRDRRGAHFLDAVFGPGGFSPEEAAQYVQYAKRTGMPFRLNATQAPHAGAVELAIQSGATSIDGLNTATPAEIEAIGRSRTIGTLIPEIIGGETTPPPARALIRAGAAVALATGFQPSVCSTLSMQMVISLGCTLLKMTPEEAIAAATINGAHALGRSDVCGSLESGKQADLTLFNISDYREIPFCFGANLASLVMRKGEVIWREGAVTCPAPA